MRWIVIVAVVVIAVVAYQFLSGSGDQQVAERVEDAAERTAEATQEAVEATTEAAQDVAEEAGEALDEAAEATAEVAEEAVQAVEETAEQVTGATEGAPEQAESTADQAAAATDETADEAAAAVEETVEEAGETAAEAGDAAGELAAAALTVGDVNVGDELGGIIDRTTETLQGITDAASAEAAVPTLEEIGTDLTGLSDSVEQLPGDSKKVLASLLSESVPTLKSLADQVREIEGVGDVVAPALDTIVAQLDDWAQQPA